MGDDLPPVWHVGECIDNTRSTSILGGIAAVDGYLLKQMPYAFASPEWSNEKGLDAALAFRLLGISSYHCVEAPIYGSKNVIEFLKDGTQELLGATMVVNTNPKDLAKKIVVDMVNKRKKLGWCIPDSISDSLNIIKNESKSNKVHFTMVK